MYDDTLSDAKKYIKNKYIWFRILNLRSCIQICQKKDFIGYICVTLNTSIIALAIDSDSFTWSKQKNAENPIRLPGKETRELINQIPNVCF